MRKLIITFVVCCSLIFFSGFKSHAQETDLEALIKEISTDSQKGAIFNYTYLMKLSYKQYKMGGRKFTRLYEAILPARFSLNRIYQHQFVLLEDSEKKITTEDIINARKEVARELERAENEAEKNNEAPPLEDGGYWTIGLTAGEQRIRIDILQILKKSILTNLHRKEVGGKTIILLDFAPNPNAVFEKSLSYLSKIEGQIWIDETDKRIIRIEGFAPGELAKQKDKDESERQKEMVFFYLQTKVSEGGWFPQTVFLNFGQHPEIFGAIEMEFSFNNYKKSRVDVQDYVESPKETPSETPNVTPSPIPKVTPIVTQKVAPSDIPKEPLKETPTKPFKQ